MGVIETRRNRPERWGPTRALLWERWRTGGWLLVAACLVPWLAVAYVVKRGRPDDPGLYLATLLAFVVLTILLLVRYSRGELSLGPPSHQLRLPMGTARLALINYGYALFWVAVFAVPLALTTQLSEIVRGSMQRPYDYLLLLTISSICFVWMHLVTWTPAVRRTDHLLVVGMMAVVIPLYLISEIVLAIVIALQLPESYCAYLWCFAAGVMAIAGFFPLWFVLAIERRNARAGTLPSVLPRGHVRQRKPFASPLRAQVWYEFRRYRNKVVVIPVSLTLLPILFVTLLLATARKLDVFTVLSMAHVARSLMVVFIPMGAWTIGMLLLSENHLIGTRHRPFLFARPLATRLMANARLRAFARIAVVLFCVAVAVEGAYQASLYAGKQIVNTRVAEARVKAGLDPDGPLPPGMGSVQLRKQSDFVHRTANITQPTRLSNAALFAALTWSCLTAPPAAAVVMCGASFFGDILGFRSGAGLYALSILFTATFLVSARACLRQHLVRWRTIVLCGLAAVACAALLLGVLQRHAFYAEDAALLITVPLLPVTLVPFWLHRQRHR